MPSPDAVRAWQAAIRVAVGTRRLLLYLPPRGFAELRDQMIRSSESIANNIAEGRGSAFEREYIRFLDIAARSANELSSQLTMAMEYGIIPKQQAFTLNGTVICTRRMIESLRDAVQRRFRAQQARERAARRTSPKPRPGE
jgi:four helix bundle protein